MRIGSDDLRNSQISLRQLAKRRGRLFFTTTAATAAGFLLLRFAAAAIAFGHARGSFVRRWLRVRNIGNHLRQFKVIVLGQFSILGLHATIPEEQTSDDDEQKGEARDNP